MTTKKGGRPATGSIKWRRNAQTGRMHWHAQITLADGSRPFAPLDPKIPREDVARAKVCALLVSEEARRIGAVPDTVRETCAEWFDRFHKHKAALGLSTVGDMRGRFSKWFEPTIGHKDPRAVTREDIEAIVRRLDRSIVAWQKHEGDRGQGRISPATGGNIWGELAHAFDEMVRAKDPKLRVLTVNPCASVRGPETGPDREGPILYSDEVLTLLRGYAVDEDDRDVPLYRRRTYAVAIYSMSRRSELAAITAGDVDLPHDTITVSKQVDRKAKKADAKATKKTKTRRTRTIDVERNLRPLIEQLVAHPEGKGGRLLRVPPSEDYAELLRKDLWTVGVRRDALHTEDATRTKLWGHHLRDTGLTHMAVRGDAPIAIQWRAGHTDFKTTQGYIDRGRVEARRIGRPLPPLPPEVLSEGPGGFATSFATLRNLPPNVTETIGHFATPTGIEEAA
jgi:integrase